jgi:nicotinic acid phosphoribosyltransferase
MLSKVKQVALGVAALTGAAVGGAAVAGAATSHSGTATTPTTAGQPPPALRNMPAPGTAAHEDAEKPVTGDDAEKAKAAAVKAVGGGTAGSVTTDYFGNGYEVTVTKSDGSKVEIHLDSSFEVMQHGPPGGSAGRGGGPPAAFGTFN